MIVEVKIQCDCGSRYKFDVEPVRGRMPQPVKCPVCGADGTPAADSLLATKLKRPIRNGSRDRFGLGLAGAFAAAILAMMAWYCLIKLTGYPLGFAAWGVGLVVGFGARALGREGSRRLGLAAGGCAFVAILAGQLLARPGHETLQAAQSGGGIGWWTVVWLLMAVLSAFKLASNRAR